MSEMEFHFGKLKKVDLNGKTIEEFCEEKCKKNNYTLSRWENNYTELLLSIEHGKYHLVDNELYEIISDNYSDDPYISHLTKNADGTFDYIFSFYNGGTCFSEMVKDAITEFKANN